MRSTTCQISGQLTIGGGNPLTIIAGPCLLESTETCLEIGEHLLRVCTELGLPYIFKASFDKANRSSIHSPRGPGLDAGLAQLAEIRAELNCPITTDVHEASQAAPAAEVVDLLQLPAFLCRQTDLLVAAAETGKPVNVKKGQFLSPAEMEHVEESGLVRRLFWRHSNAILHRQAGSAGAGSLPQTRILR